jgi:hypothetical protein
MLAGAASLQTATAAADLMARELGWNEEEIAEQLRQYTAEYNYEYAPPASTFITQRPVPVDTR